VGDTISLLQADITDPTHVTLDANHQFVCAGFYETHSHLDKACILDRCSVEQGGKEEAAAESKRGW
jgi:cytosine deaminase